METDIDDDGFVKAFVALVDPTASADEVVTGYARLAPHHYRVVVRHAAR